MSTSAEESMEPGELQGELFAAVDLGSNSFHLIVARYEHGTLHVIDRIKEMVRLAEGVTETGDTDPIVAQRALDCLARFGQRIAGIAPHRIAAVGTNAMRRMHDGWRFLDDAEAALGHEIEIISGEEEARLIYLGVAHGIAEVGQRLVIDIGGGSTELVIGRDFNAVMVESLFVGCVAITQRFFRDGRISAKRWRKAHDFIALEMSRYARAFRDLGWQEALGASGTMRAVRSVLMNNGWSERGITPDGMTALQQALIESGHSDKISLGGLSERRRPVFVGGAVIVQACLSVLGIERLLVTDYALREGLLYDMIGRIEHADPRSGAVQAMVARYNVDSVQAEHVATTAQGLLEQVRQAWALDDDDTLLLHAAAWLHEIGLSISHHGYHRHGAYLLQHSDLPGFSRLEQMALGWLVLNHRNRSLDDAMDPMLERRRVRLRRLAVLLRLSVILHRDRADNVPSLKLKVTTSGKLKVTLPPGWLDDHPLTAEDLQREVANLARIEASLKIG